MATDAFQRQLNAYRKVSMAHEIFISYRRKDTAGYAGRLYDYLVTEFGQTAVLFDVEVRGTAEILREWVSRVVPEAAVELVLIGDEWLTDRYGRRRLDDIDDIVRLEVELALKHKVPIIPVLVDGMSFPDAIDLPESITELARFKRYELNNSYWGTTIKSIVEAISFAKTHVLILNRGVDSWNDWRKRNPHIAPNLTFGDFAGKNLDSANLSNASLCSANLSGATLRGANLKLADLSQAQLREANLEAASLAKSNLKGANLERAVLRQADLRGADLSDANLNNADLRQSNLTQCLVSGVSVWSARLEQATQSNLLLTRSSDYKEDAITVDSIQMAVVVHLLLTSGGVRELIDILSSKMVLVLGWFAAGRGALLATMKDQLRAKNYVDVLLDFNTPSARDYTETVSLLAHMSRFIVADLSTESVPAELMHVVQKLPSVPIVPVVRQDRRTFALFESLSKYPSVLEPIAFPKNHDEFVSAVDSAISRAETYLAQRQEKTTMSIAGKIFTTVSQPTTGRMAPNKQVPRTVKKRRR